MITKAAATVPLQNVPREKAASPPGTQPIPTTVSEGTGSLLVRPDTGVARNPPTHIARIILGCPAR